MVAIRTVTDRRIKVSLSLDPASVEYLDTYAAAHPPLNRSRVVELAVREFRKLQTQMELEAQYAEPELDVIQRELEDWRHIRRAAARRALASD